MVCVVCGEPSTVVCRSCGSAVCAKDVTASQRCRVCVSVGRR